MSIGAEMHKKHIVFICHQIILGVADVPNDVSLHFRNFKKPLSFTTVTDSTLSTSHWVRS